MPIYIIKLTEGDQSWYLEYSSVVDAPTTYGMTLEEFKEYYQVEYGRSSMDHLNKRLERVEEKGTSSLMHRSAEELLDYNRAGRDETCLSIQQIIDFYCKHPDWKTKEEFKAYDSRKNLPIGKKIEHDD